MTLAEARQTRWFGPAAIALVVGVPLLAGGLTLGNLTRWSEARAASEAAAARLAQIEERVRSQAARGQAAPADTSALFLAAPTGSLARAELQRHLATLVERTGGRLIEVRGDEGPQAAAALDIVLRLSLDIRNDGLFDLLSAIETALPILTVDTLGVRPAPSRTTGSSEADPTLRVALAVRAHRLEVKP